MSDGPYLDADSYEMHLQNSRFYNSVSFPIQAIHGPVGTKDFLNSKVCRIRNSERILISPGLRIYAVLVVTSMIRIEASPPATANLLSVDEKSRAKMPLDSPVTIPTTALPFA